MQLVVTCEEDEGWIRRNVVLVAKPSERVAGSAFNFHKINKAAKIVCQFQVGLHKTLAVWATTVKKLQEHRMWWKIVVYSVVELVFRGK